MSLTPLQRAKQIALELSAPAQPVSLPIEEVWGLHLAEDVISPRDLPGCDNSAMDGYALIAAQTRGATRDRPATFTVVETIYAGAKPTRTLGPGEAARIFTGAPVPPGADVVVRQEAARATEGGVEIVIEADAGDNVRRRGEELKQGTVLFREGQKVDAYVVGVLASVGLAQVRVRPRPRVAVMALGDELLEPGTPAEPHQIHDSNRIFLSAMAREAGAEIIATHRVKDEVGVLTAAVKQALESCEVLITSGGASVGDRDLIKGVLRSLGAEFAVDGVALKPGKPVGLARFGEKQIVVLPGNPGAAAVGFDQLARPLLLARQGAAELRAIACVRLDGDRHKQAGMTYLLSGRVDDCGGELWGRIRPQGAGQLLQNVGMMGWVVLPPGRADFRHGEWVRMELLSGVHWTTPAEASRLLLDERAKQVAVSFVGWSGSGKTTLVEALIPVLRARGLRVAAMKHTSHAHGVHKPGSDTERFMGAGAIPVAFSNGAGTQLSIPAVEPWNAVQRLARVADLVLVEGWKEGPLPKVLVRAPEGEVLELHERPLLTIDRAGPWTPEQLERIADDLLKALSAAP